LCAFSRAGRAEQADPGAASERERSIDRTHARRENRASGAAIAGGRDRGMNGTSQSARRSATVEWRTVRRDRAAEQRRAENQRERSAIHLHAIAERNSIDRTVWYEQRVAAIERSDVSADGPAVAARDAHALADACAWKPRFEQ